jgi:hypothetical protein
VAKSDLREWAVKGAEQRLIEIAEEAKLIYATFPELRARGREVEAAIQSSATRTASPRSEATAHRPQRQMSAAGRKRIGDAAKRRWAEWRAKQNASANTDAGTASAATAARGRARKKK